MAILAAHRHRFDWLRAKRRRLLKSIKFSFGAPGGSGKGVAGIIAECRVIGAAAPRPESEDARPFWRRGSAGSEVLPRANLSLIPVASTREVIRREWCE